MNPPRRESGSRDVVLLLATVNTPFLCRRSLVAPAANQPQNAPEPTSVPELRSYLGIVNYYHKFLKNLSTVLAPRHNLLQKDTSWHWESEQANAFVESKMLLQSSQVLEYYITVEQISI